MSKFKIDCKQLRVEMAKCGITSIKELAERSNISRRTLESLFNRTAKPSVRTMYALAAALKLNGTQAGKIFFA